MRENAWLTASKLFAPYDGITRFRFKGSPTLARRTLSQWLPRSRPNVNGKCESGKQELISTPKQHGLEKEGAGVEHAEDEVRLRSPFDTAGPRGAHQERE